MDVSDVNLWWGLNTKSLAAMEGFSLRLAPADYPGRENRAIGTDGKHAVAQRIPPCSPPHTHTHTQSNPLQHNSNSNTWATTPNNEPGSVGLDRDH